MKNKEQFDKSVNTLVKAYINNTLEHGTCTACAVGNLICDSMYGGDHAAWVDAIHANGPFGNWTDVFCTDSDTQTQTLRLERYKEIQAAMEQIDSTGYTVDELARIEYAFECANPSDYNENEMMENPFHIPQQLKTRDEAMFDGLLAVYDVLCDIHEVTAEDNVPAGELVFCK